MTPPPAPLQVLVSYSWIVDSLLDMLTQAIEPVRRTAVGPSVATLLLVQRIKVGLFPVALLFTSKFSPCSPSLEPLLRLLNL